MIRKISGKKYFNNGLLLLKKNKSVVLSVILLGILADIFFVSGSSDLRIFSIITFYVISIWLYRLKSRITFLLCLMLLGLMFIEFLLSGASERTEKAAVWLVLFLAIGIIQQWRE